MTVVELADRVLVLGLDQEAGGIVGEHLKKQGVVLETQTTIERIVGTRRARFKRSISRTGRRSPPSWSSSLSACVPTSSS